MRQPTSTVHPIHFEDHSPHDFERLVFAHLLRSQRWQSLEWYGQVGSDLGRDIWGIRESDKKQVCVQCANRRSVPFIKIARDIDAAAEAPNGKPDTFLLVAGGSISAQMRDRIKGYGSGKSIDCEVWSGPEFEERLRATSQPLIRRFVYGDVFPDSSGEINQLVHSLPYTRTVGRQSGIAVLPFSNIGGNKNTEYFSDGLTEEIIHVLARVPGLKVIARTSAFAFKGKTGDVRWIGDALGVVHILEGSVRKSGGRLRISAKLINALDGTHRWSQSYDRELGEVIEIQDVIATAIARELQLELVPRTKHTPDSRAHGAYLMGLFHLSKNTSLGLDRGKHYFDRAIKLDPRYVEPHLALARTYLVRAAEGLTPPMEMMPLVRDEAKIALSLDPSEPGALALEGVVAAVLDYDWRKVEAYFKVVMDCQAVPPLARWYYCNCCLLPQGRFQEVLEQWEEILEQDPMNVMIRSVRAHMLSFAEMPDEAIEAAQDALQIDETHWLPHYVMAETYIASGRSEEALSAAEKAYRVAPWNARVTGLLAGVLAKTGDIPLARARMSQLQGAAPIGMAFFHLVCSEIEAAVDWFEKVIEQRDPFAVTYVRAPFTKPLRASPRWAALAKMMNLD